MAILGGFRADQLISQLVGEEDTNSPSAHKLVERLKKIGPKVIPRIIDALAMSDKNHTIVFVDILASYVNDKTLKFYKEGLSDGGERVIKATAWALSSSNNFNANALLDFFDEKEVSKPALIEVLKVHKADLSVHDLLRRAYELEPKEKAALFAIIESVVTADMVPDLIARMGGKDPVVKIHLINLLAKFDKEEINQALEMQLKDTSIVDMHEAFAAQVLSVTKALASKGFAEVRLGRSKAVGEIDEDNFNVYGGSLSIGHPFGATGARMVTTMANELARTGKETALLGICAAGGLGAAAVLEAVN